NGSPLKKTGMIKGLRKRHFQIWLLWAFLLPAGIISAWLVIPVPATNSLLQPEASKALPVLFKKAFRENYAVAVRHNDDKSQWQLEWMNKGVLTYPTATIYKAAEGKAGVKDGVLIGRIEARGNYYFPL